MDCSSDVKGDMLYTSDGIYFLLIHALHCADSSTGECTSFPQPSDCKEGGFKYIDCTRETTEEIHWRVSKISASYGISRVDDSSFEQAYLDPRW